MYWFFCDVEERGKHWTAQVGIKAKKYNNSKNLEIYKIKWKVTVTKSTIAKKYNPDYHRKKIDEENRESDLM